MVTAEAISSRSIGFGVFALKPQTVRLHYKCNLTNESPDFAQMVSLNDTRNHSPYSVFKGLSPYTNYTVTCLVLKDGVDQCYTGSDITQTSTDSKLLLFSDTQALHTAYCMCFDVHMTGYLSPGTNHLFKQDPVLHLETCP